MIDIANTIEGIIQELDEASTYEGTELGEYWRGLCSLGKVVKYSNDDELIQTIETEIRSQYKWMRNNFTWVEHKPVECDRCGKGHLGYWELVWNGDL